MSENITRSDEPGAVETDERNYARVKAGETCRQVLIPRANPQEQLDWRVTLAEGSRYAPPDETGIYAKEVSCKHGVQCNADVFGRDTVSLASGGATHTLEDGTDELLGTRILGSVLSEGSIHTTTPASIDEGWERRPVLVFGDVMGGHVTVEQPLIVYGNLVAEQSLRVDAPTLVMGETRSYGKLDAKTLYTLTIAARDDISIGENVIVTNPLVRSMAGDIQLREPVGLLDSRTVTRLQEEYATPVPLGDWLFETAPVWEPGVLRPEDITDHEDGTIASRAWRTTHESPSEYEFLKEGVGTQVADIRSDPPGIDQLPPTRTEPHTDERTWTGVTVETAGTHYTYAQKPADEIRGLDSSLE